jgi:Cytochrome c554 and c-prime
MNGRFKHSAHVLRVLALFAFGFLAFVVLRYALIPPGFGLYGFYRAGALTDIAALPQAYAGETACQDCHGGVFDERKTNTHASVHCEACHGPLAAHARGNFDTMPTKLPPRALCLTCHTKSSGKPATFMQIDPADHMGDGPCTDCHKPHSPKLQVE